jgi:hypothetical protein
MQSQLLFNIAFDISLPSCAGAKTCVCCDDWNLIEIFQTEYQFDEAESGVRWGPFLSNFQSSNPIRRCLITMKAIHS